ncbi:MAG: PQQ-binding-like beta-propeller repeat protein, partial [Rhodospirillales bacterium]|nr:PQQ-binding-like beta-propeller repeat protein [Rhodospirillales bacterium]
TGALLWKQEFKDSGEVMPTTMAVDDGRLCIQTVSHVVCLDAVAGEELWRSQRPVARSRFSWSTATLVVRDGVVLSIDRAAQDNVDESPPDKGIKWIMDGGHYIKKKQDAELIAFSLADGKELWRAPYFENYDVPQDIFVLDDVVWVGDLRRGVDPGFTEGRDLKTGKVTVTLPPQSGGNHPSSHHRCYRNKATLDWFLLGRGPMQLVNTKNGASQGLSWARGACQYGIMPANGLIYAPQHSCACAPEELLVGFNALSPRSNAGEGSPPLEKGPAYGEIANLASASSEAGWPTYRRDARRSGYQNLLAPDRPNLAWTTKLLPPITAPVAAEGMVFVAETERHTLHALRDEDGEPAWTFIASGRIDSPPTLFGGLCLFGTRNGFVYCLRASDGALVWRFRAAPRERLLFAYEQLESVWPVHGSVLVDDTLTDGAAAAYFAAGRSSHIDGGIRLHALELKTGKLLHKADVNMAPGADGAGTIREGALPAILSVEKGAIWMAGLGVDKNLARVEDLPHVFAPRGFLDDTWWHRTYWIYETAMKTAWTGWVLTGNRAPAGRLLALGDEGLIYGYGRMAYRPGAGHVDPDATKNYKLFAEVLEPEQETTEWLDKKREVEWTAQLPFVAKSVVLTRDALLVAGGRSLTESAESHGPGTFWVASREDGSEKAACALPAPPVLDGVALTGAGVFISTIDGTVACLADKE